MGLLKMGDVWKWRIPKNQGFQDPNAPIDLDNLEYPLFLGHLHMGKVDEQDNLWNGLIPMVALPKDTISPV